jgi:hypothetical protein
MPHYSAEEIDYQFVWHNVENTKLIQVGISIAKEGDHQTIATWQFNLQFDLAK